jgi:hypothetical protein
MAGNNISGTVYLGKQSYSGADIKLMIYSTNPSAIQNYWSRKQKEITDQIEDIEQELKFQQTYLPNVRGATNNAELSVEKMANENIKALKDQLDVLYGKEIPKEILIPLASASSISVSAFREKVPVRACGFVAPKGFTHGPRTVAGSIVFVQFDEHALAPFLFQPPSQLSCEEKPTSVIQIDQLPPMIVVAQFANEYGSISELTIYGLEFIDDGNVFSIDDLFSENTCTYVARDYNVLLKRGDIRLNNGGSGEINPTSASALLYGLSKDEDYQSFIQGLDVTRRNSFR